VLVPTTPQFESLLAWNATALVVVSWVTEVAVSSSPAWMTSLSVARAAVG
jgi:hypothetical protein